MGLNSSACRRWLLPVGLSLLINSILLIGATKLLSTTQSHADYEIEVQLEHPIPIEAPRTAEQSAVKPVASNMLPQKFGSEFERAKAPDVKKPKAAITRKPLHIPITPSTVPQRPSIARQESNSKQNLQSKVGRSTHPGGGGGGGGTTATGPGTYTEFGYGGGVGSGGIGGGHGTGVGTGTGAGMGSGTGSGIGSGSGSGIGSGSGSGGAVAEHPIKPVTPPPPPPPVQKEEPKPKGETRPPKITKQIRPIYPSDAKDDGVEGTVVMLITVSPNGKISHVKIVEGSGDRRLDRAAEQTVKMWEYEPALRDGIPAEATIRVRVQFRIE